MKNVTNRGNLWNQQEELLLMDELSEKIPLETIATAHGRTVKAIEMRMERMIRKQYEQKYTLSSLCNLYNKTEQEIKNIILTEESPGTQPKEKQDTKKNISLETRLLKIETRLDSIEKYIYKIYKKLK